MATGWSWLGSSQHLHAVQLLCFSIDVEREGMGVSASGGCYRAFNSQSVNCAALKLLCLRWQVCTEDCCRGYYAMVCYFNEVLNKIVSTSGNREMTCQKALVKLSNMPEPTDLQDIVQGSSFLFPSDLGLMGWLEALYQCMGKGLLMLSPSFKY